MTRLAASVIALSLLASACSVTSRSEVSAPMPQPNDVRVVGPALEKYTQDRFMGEVWKLSGLSAHDRSIVTLAALITRNQTIEMPHYLI
jgi:4-carboxymuconolactone decarboxylase